MTLPAFDREIGARDWDLRSGEPVRMAVVGLGWFSTGVAIPAIEAAQSTTVSVLVTGSPAEARTLDVADSATVLSYADYHDGKASEAYDAVYVATPNSRHLEAIETAAANGKDVLSEKPLDVSTERAQSAVEACESASVSLMVAYRMQFDPAVRALKGLLQDGLIGRVQLIHGTFSFPTLSMSGPDTWRFDPDIAGGGPLIDLGVYPINTTRYLLESEPNAVSAVTTTPTDPFKGMEDTGQGAIEENIATVLDFGDAVATFTASFNAEMNSALEFVGTEGRLAIDPAFEVDEQRTITYTAGEESVTLTPEPQNEITETVEYFAASLENEDLTAATGRDGRQDLHIVEAAYESRRTGETVDLS